MDFNSYSDEQKFIEMWNTVRVERPVPFSLFTFGDSQLAYFLVTSNQQENAMVKVSRGDVKVSRPQIITPFNANPEFQNFFETLEEEEMASYLMTRTAAFSNLRLANQAGPAKIVSDSVEEAVSKLNSQLDSEEEEHVAILSAPEHLSGIAVLKYASERIMESTPGNVQELRERGFLS